MTTLAPCPSALPQGLPARFEDVQEQLRNSVVRLAGVESDLARVRAEAQRYADQLQRAGAAELGSMGMNYCMKAGCVLCWGG